MKHDPRSRRLGRYFALPPRWQRIFWPIVAVSGGGTTIALWLEEEAIVMAECAPVAALPGLAGLIYWFNHLVFKMAKPRREDPSDKTTSRENQP